ncbi:unnamed protein product [Phytomonas sp. EM1]|nr:unnamed protein product [Phytomonas sp. EM1]|eukprot:CCW59813.1 unnamed protein product [Phytomonas sp. isolate EM1]
MSELKEILTQPQRIKHHELLQFLSSHPNVEYSIAQLDYLLPRGAALQRFPEEWFGLMARGACGNRNIELLIENNESTPGPAPSRSSFSRPLPDRAFLICRRPELRSLTELQGLINTPGMIPDPEECVGLHTDQIILSKNLLRDSQRSGLAFYFSDKFIRREVIGGNGGGGDAVGGLSSSASATTESSLGQRQLLSEISGVATAVVPLPLGIRIRYKLFTWRGIAVSDAHCLPIRLQLQERLLVTFDNENAVLRRIDGGKDGLQVRWRVVVPSGAVNHGGINPMTPSLGTTDPLSIRARSITSERVVSAAPFTKSEIASTALPHHNAGARQTIRSTKVQMDIEAVCAVSPFKLIFVVNGQECIVNMEVVDVDTTTPGVLIGREREPGSFSLPLPYRLMDPMVLGDGMTSARSDLTNAPAKDTNAVQPKGEDELHGTVSATASPSSPINVSGKATYGLLPWWQNSSPLVLGVRDATYPSEEVVVAATGIVYAKSALLHEAQLRAVRHLMRKKMADGGPGSTSGRQDRRRVRRKPDLRNRHMLHFGLDASFPFSPKQEGV